MSEPSTATAKPFGSSLPPRVAVIAAHPDDETLGFGGQLRHIVSLTLIHITDGAPRDLKDARRAGFATREDYAQERARELDRALEAAGVQNARRRSLRVVDQEAVLHLAYLVRELMEELAAVDAVITHSYEGGHPDHDACALSVQWACTLLRREGRPAPTRLEFASYHARNGQPVARVFWAVDGCPERVVALSAEDLGHKRAALDEFVTQRSVLRPFPLEIERLRQAPDYNFAAPPPPRTVLYDQFNWPITSAQWCEKARRAALELGAARESDEP